MPTKNTSHNIGLPLTIAPKSVPDVPFQSDKSPARFDPNNHHKINNLTKSAIPPRTPSIPLFEPFSSQSWVREAPRSHIAAAPGLKPFISLTFAPSLAIVIGCPVLRVSVQTWRSEQVSPYPTFVSDPGSYRRFPGRRLRPDAMTASVLRVVAFSFAFTTLAALAQAQQQPIAYSHKKHIALGLQCLDCHSMADIGPAATIPSVTKCLLCHQMIAADKPEIKKMADYAAKGHEIPWQRVYGFEPQALVKFNHAAHLRAKVQCATCHGDMTQAETAQKLVNHNMGTCLTCHRQKGASQDCATCHY